MEHYWPDGVKLLAERILNDIIREMSVAIKRNDDIKIRNLKRQLEETCWCGILKVTPTYCIQLAKRYDLYVKRYKKT